MPIRFRCVYCDKLLGIAHRKAGSVVNCPQCSQPLIVPTPEPEPTAAAVAPTVPGKLFERDDFEAMLQGDATLRTPDGGPRRSRGERKSSNSLPPKPFPVERSLPAPDELEPAFTPHPPRPQSGIVISTGLLVLILVGVLLLIGVAFGGGIVVGRMLQ